MAQLFRDQSLLSVFRMEILILLLMWTVLTILLGRFLENWQHRKLSHILYIFRRLWHHFIPDQNVWSHIEFIWATYFGHCATWLPLSFLSFLQIPLSKHSRPEHGCINRIFTIILKAKIVCSKLLADYFHS